MRCQDESWALEAEREGKEDRSLAAAGLVWGRVQPMLRAARCLLYLK